VAEAGGRDNAFTSRDYTAYFQIVPKAALPEMMKLEADRMANLTLDAKEFAAEIKVVMEERRLRTDDNPQALVHETLNSTHVPGPSLSPPDHRLDGRSRAHDLAGRARLVPAVVCAEQRLCRGGGRRRPSRGVPPGAEILRRAQDAGLPERKPQNEPEQAGIRRLSVKAPAKLPYLRWRGRCRRLRDVQKDRDPYALEMLAAVLDGHDASRFSKNLVRGSRIAQSAGAGYDGTLRGEASFILDGQPAEGKTMADLEAALRAELKRIQDEGVSAEELAG
jgi:zinc protease